MAAKLESDLGNNLALVIVPLVRHSATCRRHCDKTNTPCQLPGRCREHRVAPAEEKLYALNGWFGTMELLTPRDISRHESCSPQWPLIGERLDDTGEQVSGAPPNRVENLYLPKADGHHSQVLGCVFQQNTHCIASRVAKIQALPKVK